MPAGGGIRARASCASRPRLAVAAVLVAGAGFGRPASAPPRSGRLAWLSLLAAGAVLLGARARSCRPRSPSCRRSSRRRSSPARWPVARGRAPLWLASRRSSASRRCGASARAGRSFEELDLGDRARRSSPRPSLAAAALLARARGASGGARSVLRRRAALVAVAAPRRRRGALEPAARSAATCRSPSRCSGSCSRPAGSRSSCCVRRAPGRVRGRRGLRHRAEVGASPHPRALPRAHRERLRPRGRARRRGALHLREPALRGGARLPARVAARPLPRATSCDPDDRPAARALRRGGGARGSRGAGSSCARATGTATTSGSRTPRAPS